MWRCRCSFSDGVPVGDELSGGSYRRNINYIKDLQALVRVTLRLQDIDVFDLCAASPNIRQTRAGHMVMRKEMLLFFGKNVSPDC